MNKLKIIAIILLGWHMTVFAQDKSPKTSEERAQKISAKLAQELSLSEAQKEKVYKIAVSNFQSADQVRAKHAEDRKAMHNEMKANRADFEKQVKSLLNQDQATKWDQLKAERKAKHKEHKKRGHQE